MIINNNTKRISLYKYLVFVIPLTIILCEEKINAQENGDTATFKKNIKFTAYPALGYSPETSLSFGAVGIMVFNQHKNEEGAYHRPSTLSPYFLYTLRNQFLSAIELEYYPDEIYNLNTSIRFFNYPDYYYGIGNQTTKSRELYNNKFFKWDGNAFWSYNRNIFIGIAYQFQVNQISDLEPNGELINEQINGINGGSLFGAGPIIKFDSRNDIFYPKKGIYFEFKTIFYPNSLGNDYAFNSFKLDFRTFHTVFSEKNILGIQLYLNHTNGKSIPFYMLPQLGGDERLRGIEHENRYRDSYAYYFQVEGRRHLFWRLGGVLFAGLGDVNSNLQSMRFSGIKYVAGIGGRFQPFKDENLNIRFDIGKGPDTQYAIYLGIREAF